MEGIAVESDRLVAAGSDVRDLGAQLAAEIRHMDGLLGQIRSGWRSERAAPAFASRMQGYLEEAIVLKDALIAHGTTLAAAGTRFARAENELANGMGAP